MRKLDPARDCLKVVHAWCRFYRCKQADTLTELDKHLFGLKCTWKVSTNKTQAQSLHSQCNGTKAVSFPVLYYNSDQEYNSGSSCVSKHPQQTSPEDTKKMFGNHVIEMSHKWIANCRKGTSHLGILLWQKNTKMAKTRIVNFSDLFPFCS
jgi:hypothetical protein